MKEIFIEEYNLTMAYHKALVELYEQGDIVDSTDWNCKCKELSITIHVLHPLQEPMISRLALISPESLQQYVEEICDGILDFQAGDKFQYTYHKRMACWGKNKLNQIEFIIEELRNNPNSRRAVIDVRDNECDAYSEDPACLNHLQFFIRDNKLDLEVLFRSNDSSRASFFNMFGLISLQKMIADELGVEVGTYTHRANSFHCYEADFKNLENYVKAIKEKPLEKLTFNYINDWKPKMENTKQKITEKIRGLKN